MLSVAVLLALALVLGLPRAGEPAGAAAPAERVLHTVAPPPAWVEPLVPDYDAAVPPDVRNGAHLLLYDRQTQVLPNGTEEYSHVAVRATTAAAVQDHAHFDITVDPAHPSLRLHFLRVVRGRQTIDQLPLARIAAFPQADRREREIYDGDYDVDVLLEDVRPGDVVEYAWTMRRTNPVFPKRFAHRFDLAWPDPVRRLRLRVVHRPDEPLDYRVHAAALSPLQLSRGGRHELVFDQQDVPAMLADPDLPSWYWPWPYVEISARANWGQVAREAAALFAVPNRRQPAVAQLVERIRGEGGTREEQALRALQFVQEEVRYTSIAIGRGALEPTDPAAVLERRFGDCKDKSLLLVTLLRALGVEAHAALVHSRRGHVLPETLPTPYAFDHAIVRASIDGSVYWIDPTRAKQSSPLPRLESPDFGHALVLASDTRELTAIPRPRPDARRREVHVELDLRAGLEQPARLSVATRYFGSAADDVRHDVAAWNVAEREKSNTAYYARYYPSTKLAAPLAVSDDPVRNELEIRESYRLDTAFVNDGEGTSSFTVHADELEGFAEPLGIAERTTPLALSYPVSVAQRIDVLLPEEWPIQKEETAIDDPAFRYRSEVRGEGHTVHLDYEYEARADHVPAAEVAQYLQNRERMGRDLGYVLTDSSGVLALSNLTVAPLPLVVLLVALGVGIWIATHQVARYDPPAPVPDPSAPSGFRGWLILPLIGVCASPFVVSVLLGPLAVFAESHAWQLLAQVPAAHMRSAVQPLYLVSLAASALLLPFSVATATLFLRKRTSAPRMYVLLQWLTLAVGAAAWSWMREAGLDADATSPSLGVDFLRDAGRACLWTAYMQQSRRVRNTFVERRKVRAGHHATSVAVA